MSRAFTLTPVRSALAVAAIAAIAAGCGGGGASTGEFVTKVDTICGDAERAVSKIDFGTVDPTSDEATAADLEKFAVALDKALAVYRDEADRLHELEPPSLFQTQFTDSMNALATSLTEIHRASIEARNGDKAAISSSLGDLSLYGENACGGVSGLFVLTGDDLNAFPIVSSRKSRARGLVACQRFTSLGFVSVSTVTEPSFSVFHLNTGRGDPATVAR